MKKMIIGIIIVLLVVLGWYLLNDQTEANDTTNDRQTATTTETAEVSADGSLEI